MNETLLDILTQNLIVGAQVAAPFLLLLLVVGIIFGLIQAATQVNEPAIPYLAKLFAFGLALLFLGSWATRALTDTLQHNIQAISHSAKTPPKK